jgi:hypothetical protein
MHGPWRHWHTVEAQVPALGHPGARGCQDGECMCLLNCEASLHPGVAADLIIVRHCFESGG